MFLRKPLNPYTKHPSLLETAVRDFLAEKNVLCKFVNLIIHSLEGTGGLDRMRKIIIFLIGGFGYG